MLESGNLRTSAYEPSQPGAGADNSLVAIPSLFRFDKNDGAGFYTKNSPEARVVQNNQGAITSIVTQVADAQGNTADFLGTGMIVDQNGLTGTDNHVVNPTTFKTKDGQKHQVAYKRILVTTADGHVHNATVVDYNASTDKALIQIAPDTPGERFQTVKLGSSNVKPLSELMAVGFPLQDKDMHLSVGRVGVYGSQTTIGAIDPGSPANLAGMRALDVSMHTEQRESGSPVFDTDGNVVGQVEAILPNPNTGVSDDTVVTPIEDLIALIEHSRKTFGRGTPNPMQAQTGQPVTTPTLLPSALMRTDMASLPSWIADVSSLDTPYLRFSALFDSMRS